MKNLVVVFALLLGACSGPIDDPLPLLNREALIGTYQGSSYDDILEIKETVVIYMEGAIAETYLVKKDSVLFTVVVFEKDHPGYQYNLSNSFKLKYNSNDSSLIGTSTRFDDNWLDAPRPVHYKRKQK